MALSVVRFGLMVALCGVAAVLGLAAMAHSNDSADTAEAHVSQAIQQTRVTSLLTLTAEEQALVEQHTPLRVGIDSDWFPFEFINEHGEHSGISADYLKLISQRSGLIFDVVGDRPWSEVLDDFAHKNLDLLAMAAKTPQRAEYAEFARPEEFLLICPETDLQAAVGLAEKIRKIMQASGFPEGLQQTLSAGVVQYQPDESTEQALARCDTYLYQAKERGRNQVAWG